MRPPSRSDVARIAADLGEVSLALSECAATMADDDLDRGAHDELSDVVERCWATLAHVRNLAQQARGMGAS